MCEPYFRIDIINCELGTFLIRQGLMASSILKGTRIAERVR